MPERRRLRWPWRLGVRAPGRREVNEISACRPIEDKKTHGKGMGCVSDYSDITTVVNPLGLVQK